MKIKYLFPHKFKKIGWMIFIPCAIAGLITLFHDFEPEILDMKVPAILLEGVFEKSKLYGMVENNLFNEILGILLIISSLFVAFSKEKAEDEYISKIRLESLVWAVYVNYGILLFAFIFIYDFSFFKVMIVNMFTVLIFFIIRFNLQLSTLKKSAGYEE